MINTPNIQEAKNLIKKSKPPIIVKAQSEEFNRKILEYGHFNILLDIHNTNQEDNQRQLASGFNHVLAKISAKNSIAIGIDIKKLNELEKKQKAQTLARIKQNIKVARKAKTKLKLINFKDKRNAFSLILSLGASTSQAKEAIDF